jgi:hypothetical protein
MELNLVIQGTKMVQKKRQPALAGCLTIAIKALLFQSSLENG